MNIRYDSKVYRDMPKKYCQRQQDFSLYNFAVIVHVRHSPHLHTTRSNISSAAGASDSNYRHTAPPINVFDILSFDLFFQIISLIHFASIAYSVFYS